MSLAGALLMSKQKKPAAPVLPPPPPPTPTIDEAAMREETARKFARRKGHRANMKAQAQPSVAVKQLLG